MCEVMFMYVRVAVLMAVVCMCICQESSELHSSTPELDRMFRFEKNLVGKMESYLASARNRLGVLTSVSSELDVIWEATFNESGVSENTAPPTVVSKTEPWVALMKVVEWEPFQDLISEEAESWMSFVPDTGSLVGGLQAIIRLIRIYKLDIPTLAINGSIAGTLSPHALSSADLRNLAIVAIDTGDFNIALRLLTVAMELEPEDADWQSAMLRLNRLAEYGQLQEYEEQDEFGYMNDLGDIISEPITVLDDVTMEDLELRFSWGLPGRALYTNWTHVVQTYDSDKGFEVPSDKPLGTDQYEALCRGEKLKEDEGLRCFYTYGGLPYYQRWGTEMVQRSPPVTVFHNFLTDRETELLKDGVKLEMNRARVYQSKRNLGTVSKARIGKVRWMSDSRMQSILDTDLSGRINDVTGLDTSWAENLQVSVYGMGGMYEPHFDYNRAVFKYGLTDGVPMGDRMATFMIYLSDVEAGGATVFPLWKLASFPVKNAAIFWYNQYKDGMSDPSTLHAGCPVLLGNKWVANKWIHEYGQEFRHPCGLIKDSPPEHFVHKSEERIFRREATEYPELGVSRLVICCLWSQ